MAQRITILRTKLQQDAAEIIQEAAALNFDELVIIGRNKDGVHFRASATVNRLETLGMIEAAKMHIWEEWE